MNLLFLTPAYPPFAGGGERYVQSLAWALGKRGHRLTVVTSLARSEAAYWKGKTGDGVVWEEQTVASGLSPISVIRCPLRPPAGGWRMVAGLRKGMVALSALPLPSGAWLQKMGRWFPALVGLEEVLGGLPSCDLVHGFNLSWEYPALAGWRWARQRGVPFVVTPFAHLNVDAPTVAERFVMMRHQRQLLADADGVLALTGEVGRGLEKYGVVCRHLTVLGSGIETETMSAPPKNPLPELFVLFVGRLNRDKGAIDAAKAVLSLPAPCHLVLAGSPTAEFERFYARLPASEQRWIRPLGVVSESEKQALLQRCALLVLPSRTDALGLVLLEAWAQGKAVVGARAGGIPGVIDAGENGLLVGYGDVPALSQAIDNLLTNPQLARQLGENGRLKLGQQYTWDRVADRAEAAYREIMG